MIAAKAGATAVRVTLEELETYGQSGAQTLAEIKNILEAGERECDVMAASPRFGRSVRRVRDGGSGHHLPHAGDSARPHRASPQ